MLEVALVPKLQIRVLSDIRAAWCAKVLLVHPVCSVQEPTQVYIFETSALSLVGVSVFSMFLLNNGLCVIECEIGLQCVYMRTFVRFSPNWWLLFPKRVFSNLDCNFLLKLGPLTLFKPSGDHDTSKRENCSWRSHSSCVFSRT